jgi:hypothetical protein
MEQLEATSAALARFQKLALNDVGRPTHFQSSPANTGIQPTHFPPSRTSNSLPSITPPPRFHSNYKRLFSETFPRQLDSPRSNSSDTRVSEPPPLRFPGGSTSRIRDRDHSRSPSSESECCGGIMNCDDLVEEDDHGLSTRRTRSISRTPPNEGPSEDEI